ncbi:MAG: hypothetical protein Q9219_001334 [cf. Caloplaca sp. 3 TL-2023]
MSFITPHMEFLKDLSNFLPLGTLILPFDQNLSLVNELQESYPWTVCFHDVALDPKIRPLYKSVWVLLCLGWLRTFARKHPLDESQVLIRVYFLPADVGGRYVERNRKDWEHVRRMMMHLDISSEAWEGLKDPKSHDTSIGNLSDYKVSPEHYDSLFYIFNTLPSPTPSSDLSCPYSSQSIDSLLDYTRNIPGVRTDLYGYQRRSAATMVQREAQPARAPDPRFEEILGPTGGKFFYDRTTGMLFQHPSFYEEARGGILAETMGLGKTLICLAAILATKGHWPQIPPQHSIENRQTRPQVGSLMDMAAATASRQKVPWRNYLQHALDGGNDFDRCRRALESNVPCYEISTPEARRSRRPSTEKPGQVIQLSSITLIVVPLNLFSHWKNEIITHVEEEALKVLYVDSKDILLPSAAELQLYDVILMSKRRLEEEMLISDLFPGPSPLTDLHLFRIIVDEGHNFSSFGRKSNAVLALKQLHVERRWIVSGTPSSGLVGIEASTATLETLNGVNDQDNVLIQEVLESGRSSAAKSRPKTSVRSSALSVERKDLQQLGSIVADFLDLRPWANGREGMDAASWKQYIIPDEDGQRKPQSLRKVLQSLVIRHQLKDIEKDVKLSPLYNRTVYLEPKWHDKLSVNLFIMNLAVNAVTSERVDQDYMFHPKNRAALNQLITNLRHSGFYWTAFTKDEVSKSIEVSRKYLADKATSGQQEEDSGNLRKGDFDLLARAIYMGQTVLDSPSWTAFSTAHELGLYIDDFPEDARAAWSLVKDTKDVKGAPVIMGAPQMSKAQNYINSHLYASDPAYGLDLQGKSVMDRFWQGTEAKAQKIKESNNDAASPQPKRAAVSISTSTRKPPSMGQPTFSRANAHGSQAPRQKSNDLGPEVQPPVQGDESARPKSALKSSTKARATEPFDSSSVLSRTRLVGTASAKLSYLIDRITALHESEKTLVFYEGDNIAFYIAQTLELLGIQFLIYTGSLSAIRKSAYITTFNTTETFRVLLMDVHQAAHGLHIACASRVFFVNPVWQPNVEAQAIKRAHRIGQTRPVYVETLVLKDTLEDRMLRRRKNMSAQEHHKAEKSLLDDDVMEQLIQNADFIPLLPEEMDNVRKQLAPVQNPQKLFGRSFDSPGNMNDPDGGIIFPETMGPPGRKRKNEGDGVGSTSTSKARIIAFDV